MNGNTIRTDGWSDAASRRLYEDRWPDDTASRPVDTLRPPLVDVLNWARRPGELTRSAGASHRVMHASRDARRLTGADRLRQSNQLPAEDTAGASRPCRESPQGRAL
jgi:hypothetical protein